MDGIIKRRINKWAKGVVKIQKEGNTHHLLNYCECHIDRFVNNIHKNEWLTRALEVKDYLTAMGLYSMVALYISPRKKSGCVPKRFDISLLYDHLSENVAEEELYGVAPPNIYLSSTAAWSEDNLKSLYRIVLFNPELSSFFGRTVYSVEWIAPNEETKYHYLRALVFL